MGINAYTQGVTRYFTQDGRANLRDVLRFVQRSLKKRADLRTMKLVFLTGFGEGPMLATRLLREFDPKIIAVTFPPTLKLKVGEDVMTPRISDEVAAFLKAMKVDIITARLPFDTMVGANMQESEMRTIIGTLSIFGRSVPLCVQAVLQACDFGYVAEGEDVIGITGDCAAIITATSTKNFLSPTSLFVVKEFICKSGSRNVGRPLTGAKKQNAITLAAPSLQSRT